MKLHITSAKVKNLKIEDRPYEAVDDGLKGFLVRVQPSGVISYYFTYRAPDGARRRYRIGKHPGITAVAARKAAEKLAASVVQGGDPHLERRELREKRERSKQETLGGFIELKYEDWALTHQKRGRETLTLLESNFQYLYNRKLTDITAWDMQKWRSDKNKAGLKPATVNRRVTTLKAVLNKALEWGVISINPLQTIKPLKIDANSRIRYLSADEESRLRQMLDKREEDIRLGRNSGDQWREVRGYNKLGARKGHFVDHLKPMVLLALNTGLRRGEIFNLRWSDIESGKKSLIVEGQTAKSGQSRHVSLNSEAMSILNHWKKQSHGEIVFTSPVTGSHFDNIKRSWSLLREAANISDFRFHDLRHTFASKLVMAGVDLYTVKELMGHSTIQMTERYAHLAPEHKASAVEKLISNN